MICPYCQRHEGIVAMVFGSEAEYRRSGMATGEDGIHGHPVAAFAVWPGKNNIGRKPDSWWLAAPMHPNCGHQFTEYSEGDYEDWFSGIPDEEMERYVVDPTYSSAA